MSENPLKAEFKYYVDHQKEMVEQYNGKVIVIKDQKIIGVFETEAQALSEAQKLHKLGTFLVQKVEPGTSGYTQVFHSRVAFS